MISGIGALIVVIVAVVFYAFLAWFVFKNWNNSHPLSIYEYVEQFPQVKTKKGIICRHCGSRSLRNLGIDEETDNRRLITCNGCPSPLYHMSR